MKARPARLAVALLGLSLALLAAGCEGARPVTVTLGDEARAGLYWEPSKRLSPAVLLIPGAGGPKEEWIPLATRLRQQGYGVLALDWSDKGGAEPEERIAGVRAGFEFLRAQKKVDAARIGLVGAEAGAEAVFSFALREPLARLAVLVAPGSAEPDARSRREYGARPILLLSAEGEAGEASSRRDAAVLDFLRARL